jgi:hypothetical protein
MFTLGITFLSWITILLTHNTFLKHNEVNNSWTLIDDPILKMLPTYDVSLFVTCTTWIEVLILCKLVIDAKFDILIKLQWSAIIMLLCRSFLMYLVPLRVHVDNIPIKDVFLDRFFKTLDKNYKSFRNDLMFSGHLAHCLILAHIVPDFSYFLYFNSLVIIVCMLLSKAHYTIDLVVAYLISFPCVELGCKIALFLE